MPKAPVLKWLTEKGFPLEMQAASAFRSAGFEVQQSATYVDTLTEKGREIDVLARDPDLWGFIELYAVVECKSSGNPWVVLVSDDAFPPYNQLRSLAVMSDQAILSLSRGQSSALGVRKFFHAGARCGYGFRQAFSKEKDPGYAAAMNVVSACYGVIEGQGVAGWPTYSAAIPIIVVDSPLYECELTKEGSLQLTEVESSAFLFSAHFPRHIVCLVNVVSAKKVNHAAERTKYVINALRKDLEPEQEKFFAAATAKAVNKSGGQ